MLDNVEIDIKVLVEVDEECVPPSLLDEEELTQAIEMVQRHALLDLLPEGTIVELDVSIGGL
jgi:hypothetical protein